MSVPLSFPSPLVETLLHFLLIFGLSALVRALARCRSGRLRAALSWADCLRRAAPAGLPLSISETLFHFHEAGMLFCLVGKLFLGGILAFGLGFSEFLIVSRASSPTLSIAGIFKMKSGRAKDDPGGTRAEP
ncbi:hypothetical protein AAES_36758 [Amazona aestiva]|uniref:Uncharacterized protein n=1 Tax=Amazona aestiva TaxID=12930 RepID=A0A0Q3Q405_AMAAE|nr:hypothetical protein AAES_36758 [Amazona aestiva]